MASAWRPTGHLTGSNHTSGTNTASTAACSEREGRPLGQAADRLPGRPGGVRRRSEQSRAEHSQLAGALGPGEPEREQLQRAGEQRDGQPRDDHGGGGEDDTLGARTTRAEQIRVGVGRRRRRGEARRRVEQMKVRGTSGGVCGVCPVARGVWQRKGKSL